MFNYTYFQLLPEGRGRALRKPPKLPGEVRQATVAQLLGNAPDVEPGILQQFLRVGQPLAGDVADEAFMAGQLGESRVQASAIQAQFAGRAGINLRCRSVLPERRSRLAMAGFTRSATRSCASTAKPCASLATRRPPW